MADGTVTRQGPPADLGWTINREEEERYAKEIKAQDIKWEPPLVDADTLPAPDGGEAGSKRASQTPSNSNAASPPMPRRSSLFSRSLSLAPRRRSEGDKFLNSSMPAAPTAPAAAGALGASTAPSTAGGITVQETRAHGTVSWRVYRDYADAAAASWRCSQSPGDVPTVNWREGAGYQKIAVLLAGELETQAWGSGGVVRERIERVIS